MLTVSGVSFKNNVMRQSSSQPLQHARARCLLVLGIATTLIACGSEADTSQGDGGVEATTDGRSRDANADAGDFAAIDAAAPNPTVNGGGPFLCNDCMCNGADHFCLVIAGGGGPPPSPFGFDGGADASVGQCVDASSLGCQAVPSDCLPNPSCECVQKHVSGSCQLDPSGQGIVISLAVP